MARTLIGELIFKMSHNATAKGKEVEAALMGIDNAAKRLSKAPWGSAMQRHLDSLRISPQQQQAVLQSWNNLFNGMNKAALKGKDQKAAFAEWRTATLSHFAAVRQGMVETESRARLFGRNMGNIMKPAMVAMGAYTGWYLGGTALRSGMIAGGERDREYFRQDMAGIPMNEQVAIAARSSELSDKYRSVDQTSIMEMARTARNTMGSTDAGLALLEDMVKGYVTLQSAKGTQAAPAEMMRLIRGLDNLGLNAGGEVGLKSMQDVIAGAIRAAQIEGSELDVGKYFDFARRAKAAGPALSDEFLATTAPALMQDMGPDAAGNMIAMAFKSFVLGDNSINGKVYRQRQADLGLREDPGADLVDSGGFGRDPYKWVKEHLAPALTKAGVDLADDTAVAMAVGKLSGNSNASGLLIRLLTQSQQIERLRGMYGQAMGPEAAGKASERDPFVAWEGFQSSFMNLAGAISEQMNIITPGLNTVTDLINGLAAAVKDNPVLALGGMVGAGVGAFAAGSALWSLVTAGPQLQLAATMLMQAAAAQGAGGMASAGGIAGGVAGGALLGALAVPAAVLAGIGVAAYSSPVGAGEDRRLASDPAQDAFIREHEIFPSAWPRGPQRRRRAPEANTLPADMAPGSDLNPSMDQLFPQVDTTEIEAAGQAATAAGDQIAGALNVTTRPVIDTSSIDLALSKVGQLRSALQQVGASTRAATRNIESTYSDYGVVP